MKDPYKRPLLIKILNFFLFPKEYSFDELNTWYEKKYQSELPLKVKKYLNLLMGDIYQNNNFDPLGKLLFNAFVFENLKNIAFVEREHKKFNKKCIFILGLPRTGSTYFHQYLGSDKKFKCFSFWELNHIGRYQFKFLRRLNGKVMLLFQNYLTPKIQYIHKVNNQGPEECSKILLCSFISQIYPLMFHLPNYEKELLNENFDYTYEFYYKALSLIQTNKETFLLKAPMHLQAIDQLNKYFPNAKYIFLHRDLSNVLPSAYSLAQTYAHMFTPIYDLEFMIPKMNQRLSFDLEQALKNIKELKLKVLHLDYNEIKANPNLLRQKLERFLNQSLKLKYIERNKVYKKHQYELLKEIPKEFNSYLQFYAQLSTEDQY